MGPRGLSPAFVILRSKTTLCGAGNPRFPSIPIFPRFFCFAKKAVLNPDCYHFVNPPYIRGWVCPKVE